VLARDHPRTAAEVAWLIRTVVPLAGEEGSMQSMTTRQTFGSIGLTLPGDDVQAALTLAHEVQHAKLAALMDLVPLYTEPGLADYYAPWRPDPRPLASLLQGLYAHLEVARFWRHRRLAGDTAEAWQANVEFAKWRAACAEVASSVSSRPGLTSCGCTFVDGMISVLRAWQDDAIPAPVAAQADREIREHKLKWDARHRGARASARRELTGGETEGGQQIGRAARGRRR
jgi:HEXXH motif-containing protein